MPGDWWEVEVTGSYETDLVAQVRRPAEAGRAGGGGGEAGMIVEVVAVGTELLLGQIVNTNAAHLGERLAELGL